MHRSGKTTHVPFYISQCLPGKRIAVTQPRRVACTSVARYVCGLLGVAVGDEVGYSVRFDRMFGERTVVKYCTDGMMLREATVGGGRTEGGKRGGEVRLGGRLFCNYDVVIVDEAHERSVGTDVVIGLLRDAQKARNGKCSKDADEGDKEMRRQARRLKLGPLKVVIMSATIATDMFSQYFDNCPVINVPGRSHAVDVLYTKEPVEDYVRAAVDTIVKIVRETKEGKDVLAFLPGQEEIDDAVDMVKKQLIKLEEETRTDDEGGKQNSKLKSDITKTMSKSTVQDISGVGTDLSALTTTYSDCLVFPLYASLPPNLQSMPFLPLPPLASRRIIISTNIAETSLTLPDVGYVVDSGVGKVKRFNGTTGVSTLMIETVTKANAKQRMGRCGRTGRGVCLRLYTEEAFTSMNDTMESEMSRTSLTSTVLSLVKMNIDCRAFQFVEPPSKSQLFAAFMKLHSLGALDDSLQLTPHGNSMSLLPTGVEWSHMIVKSATKYGGGKVTEDVLTATAMAGAENVWVRPKEGEEKQKEAAGAHGRFRFHEGDVPTLVNLYNLWEEECLYLKGDSVSRGRYKQMVSGYKGKKVGHPEWCDKNWANGRALGKAKDVRGQLEEIVGRDRRKGGLGFGGGGGANKGRGPRGTTVKKGKGGGKREEYERFLKCVAEGLADNAAVRVEKTEVVEGGSRKRDARGESRGADRKSKYVTMKGKVDVSVHPSSFMFQRNPAPTAVVYCEMVVTKRNWIRGVTQVRREWIDEIMAEREGGGGGGGAKKVDDGE
ncbi:hypothetical protein TrRE_jg9710 [Triparma retinervis]|uniref:RNA helicase n=1 Tax=Triparma retinervis TaxID=2557542 RepID=A0A9W7ALI9_9STRA|nr:hypothetical protein TrRE_jg9710 [Triparma retinervis]